MIHIWLVSSYQLFRFTVPQPVPDTSMKSGIPPRTCFGLKLESFFLHMPLSFRQVSTVCQLGGASGNKHQDSRKLLREVMRKRAFRSR